MDVMIGPGVNPKAHKVANSRRRLSTIAYSEFAAPIVAATFVFQGITAGWRFIGGDAFELAAIAKLRLDGFDIEVARGAVDYKPDAVTIPHIGVNFMRFLGKNWSMIAFLGYSVLPDELKDSPFLKQDSDGTASILIGVQRGF